MDASEPACQFAAAFAPIVNDVAFVMVANAAAFAKFAMKLAFAL